MLGGQLADVLAGAQYFDFGGVTMVSPEGSLRIAERLCGRQPDRVLRWVMADEAAIREKCKRGSRIRGVSTAVDVMTSSESESSGIRRMTSPAMNGCASGVVTGL
jgi:hypothetical protein